MPVPSFPVHPDIDPRHYRAARRRAAIGRFLASWPFALKALGLAAHLIRHLTDSAQMYRENMAHLPFANRGGTQAVGYVDDGQEVGAFLAYRRDVRSGRIERTESGELYRLQGEVFADLMAKHPSIGNVLNFGVCYGHIDAQLAAAFPDVRFVGIDRSPLTKSLNAVEFNLPNLSFVAGDFFGYDLSSTDVLMHSRTCICFNKQMLLDVYRTAHRAGVKHVIGFEQIGTSWETFEPYEFDLGDKPSVLYRNFMFIHNYPGLLSAAGFNVERFDLVTTASDKRDLRLAVFAATRR